MRILTIIASCFDQDDTMLKSCINVVKESQSAEGASVFFDASTEKFLLEIWKKKVSQRMKEKDAIN